MASYSPGFVSLLTSQTGESSTPAFVNLSGSHSIDLESPESPALSSPCSDATNAKDKTRRTWTSKEDLILISSWLNTSKDPIVGNEQKCGTFWSRIQEYFNASVPHHGLATRELGQCKQRWGRINDIVCKFCGCYDAALRLQSSGESDNDVMRKAHEMFSNDYKSKFTLEHAWRELRHDQKWISVNAAKDGPKDKRKGVEGEEEASGGRPPGIKAAKSSKKKKGGQEQSYTELKQVLELKDRLNKQKLLEKLLEKPEPLTDMELSLKLKLMAEML